MRAPLAVLAAAILLAGCKGAPGKRLDVQDVMMYAPSSLTGNDASLQMCIVPAHRYDAAADAPGGKTLLSVPLTRADGTVGEPVYAGALGYPVTFVVKPPFFLTLFDGYLHVTLEKETITATVEGAKGTVPPPVSAKDVLWVWIGREPTKDEPDPRGTFVGVRVPK